MKLVGLWIEDFMKIKDSGFNFGSRLVFNFDFNTENRKLIITADRTTDYFDLFKNSAIQNITGIIGTNGSGKTSLLKILNLVYSQKPLDNRFIAIFEDVQSSKYFIYNYKAMDHYFDQKQDINVILQQKGEFSKEMQERGKIVINEGKAPFNDVDLIFYSNLYSNQNDNYLKRDNSLNRSVDYQTIKSLTVYRLREYLRDFDRKKNNRNLFIEESYNPLSLYHNDKLKRLITFLANADSKLALFFQDDIPFPDTLTIWPNESIFENIHATVSTILEDFEDIFPFYDFCVKNNSIENNPKQRLKNAIIYNLFFFSFNNEFFTKDDLGEVQAFIKQQPLDNSIYENINTFLMTQVGTRTNREINKVKEVLLKLDSLLKNVPVNLATGLFSSGSFELGINKSLWRLLSNLNAFTDNNSEPMFTVNLNPFSAGAGAILGQFSEFFEALKHIKNKNVLVTIDEGELYMHPEWQRKYVYSLFNFFDYFGKKLKVNFQIIVTSHSPFLVSDIPKYNLVYMKKREAGMTEVIPSLNQKATLGGNIFQLFQSGFYMKEFIGEFATNIINEAIYFLNGKESSFNTLQEVEAFTKLIGEDLIRIELQRFIEIKKISDFDKHYEIVKEDDINISDKKRKGNK